MADLGDAARQWLAERYEEAAEKCRLEDCDGHLSPCSGHVADAILSAPGVEVELATRLGAEPRDNEQWVAVLLPAEEGMGT